ncbi:MAG: hypothetical protein HFJ30_08865, partial [Clostridia bacterium]|nr:hypothetical protein [Clostridia bacterium]
LITVPGDFKVLTSEGTKVTDGIVIQDREGNEFVWVPVDSVSTGTSKPADDIRLGRYEDFATKNAIGNYIPKQDADNYIEVVTIESYFQELISNSGNTVAKNLGDFINKTKANGGYYFARYEASKGSDDKVKSQYDKVTWGNITQSNAATAARGMYSSNYVESDLINSYSWDTAIVFIQKYSGNSNYANKTTVNSSPLNTGKAGDEVCNIHDMASNCSEWSTGHSTRSGERTVARGGFYSLDFTTAKRYHAVRQWRSLRFLPSTLLGKVILYISLRNIKKEKNGEFRIVSKRIFVVNQDTLIVKRVCKIYKRRF